MNTKKLLAIIAWAEDGKRNHSLIADYFPDGIDHPEVNAHDSPHDEADNKTAIVLPSRKTIRAMKKGRPNISLDQSSQNQKQQQTTPASYAAALRRFKRV